MSERQVSAARSISMALVLVGGGTGQQSHATAALGTATLWLAQLFFMGWTVLEGTSSGLLVCALCYISKAVPRKHPRYPTWI